MKTLCFTGLFNGNEWLEPAYVTLDDQGCVQQIQRHHPPNDQSIEQIPGYAIPGFQNGHSHAFQYAMAGLAEHLPHGRNNDDFWSWREVMYRLAQQINPEQFENIAAMVYAEMLRHGITAVAEFHYLHHDTGGKAFSQPAEMAYRLISAANRSGIHLTLIPIFYQTGGFGEKPRPNQERFISATLDDYVKLLEATKFAAAKQRDTVVGIGVHSLRAVRPDDVKKAFALDPQAVTHIHVAEQKREVVDSIKHLGSRPVTWLLDNISIDYRYALIHATHCEPEELDRLAKTGATVVICPSTEGNLGDGLFGLQRYRNAGGGFAIGTDSHIGLNPFEELRWLDYGQRLYLLRRNIFCHPGEDSGFVAVTEAWRRGRLSMGLFEDAMKGPWSAGTPFDAVIVSADHPLVAGKPAQRRLSSIIYAGDASMLRGVMRRGQWLVEHGQHHQRETILGDYVRTIKNLTL